MEKKIKALLIDPEKETVTEVELEGGSKLLDEMYRVIGCDCVDAVRHGLVISGRVKPDDIWVDDEGLLKDSKHFWTLPYYNQWMAGKALIMAVDDEGDCIDHTFTDLEKLELEAKLTWNHVSEDYEPEEPTVLVGVIGNK